MKSRNNSVSEEDEAEDSACSSTRSMSGEVVEEDETGAPGNAYVAGQAQTVWDAAGDLARPVSFADSLGLRTESPPGETKRIPLSSAGL